MGLMRKRAAGIQRIVIRQSSRLRNASRWAASVSELSPQQRVDVRRDGQFENIGRRSPSRPASVEQINSSAARNETLG